MVPFTYDLLDQDQEEKNKNSDPSQDGAPAISGGGATFNQGGGAPAAESSGSGQPKSTSDLPGGSKTAGSGFVNLDKYMTANQGSGFGNQFTGNVQKDVNAGQQTLADQSNQFTNASNQGAVNWNTPGVGNWVQSTVDNAGANTTADDATKLQGYENATYQGPQSFSGSSYGTQAQGGVTKATDEANALQSEGGRFALLDQFYGRPSYSTGEKSLDNLLVQNDPTTASKSQAITQQGQNLNAQFNQANTDLGNLANANQQATANTAQQTKSYLDDATNSLTSGIDSRVADDNTKSGKLYGQLSSDLASGSLSLDDLGALGLDPGSATYGVNLQNYLGPEQTATSANVATPEEYAKYQALSQLAGVDPTYLTDNSQLGTYNPLSFDKAGYQSAVSAAGNTYQSKMAALQKQLNAYNAYIAGAAPSSDLLNGPVGFDVQASGNDNLKNIQNAIQQLNDDYNYGSILGPKTRG